MFKLAILVYRSVVRTDECPKKSLMIFIDVPFSRWCVANVWRRLWNEPLFPMFAFLIACSKIFCAVRTLICFEGSCPGKSQPVILYCLQYSVSISITTFDITVFRSFLPYFFFRFRVYRGKACVMAWAF